MLEDHHGGIALTPRCLNLIPTIKKDFFSFHVDAKLR